MSSADSQGPHQAPVRRLIVSIDVGTTFSSAAYAIQTLGEPVHIQDVTIFPGGDGKTIRVPTVVLYDPNGQLLSCGFDVDVAKPRRGTIRVDGFKLHMRPPSMENPPVEIPPLMLTPRLTATHAMADFLRYMRRAVEDSVQADEAGNKPWNALKDGVIYILSHPNGWEGQQQAELRQAVIWANLIPNTPEGQARLILVSEGEASFHSCVDPRLLASDNGDQQNPSIVVVNAGGGFVDISSFQASGEDPSHFREAGAARSILAGSDLVSFKLRETLAASLHKVEGLKGKDLGLCDAVFDEVVDSFQKAMKLDFGRSETNDLLVDIKTQIGGDIAKLLRIPKDRNWKIPRQVTHLVLVSAGEQQLSPYALPSRVIEACFEPFCAAIASGIQDQIVDENTHVLLTGGFSGSPWLLYKLEELLTGCIIHVVDAGGDPSPNIVPHGAITFFVDNLVTARVAKDTYGIRVRYTFDKDNMDHFLRREKIHECEASGQNILTDGFLKIVSKGELVPEGRAFKIPVIGEVRAKKGRPYKVDLYRYHGLKKDIQFFDADLDNFEPVCELSAGPPADVFKEQQRADASEMRSPFTGDKASLVIAIDVGTTYSGVSYTFLRPKQPSTVYNVTRFAGQGSNEKVPTVLYYDNAGELLHCGPEPAEDLLDGKDYVKVEWFKLLLGPKPPDRSALGTQHPQLPPSRTVIDVLGDFLRYMNNTLKEDILEVHDDGDRLWDSLSAEATYILTHPNGWEGPQQAHMREAAIRGGLVPNTPEGRERVEFLTEGEASFHWCMDPEANAAIRKDLSVGDHIIVADAGGGTIDVSSYHVTSGSPLRVQEATEAQCEFAGSVFVTEYFRQFAEKHFDGSDPDKEYVEHAVEAFDKKTKCLFSGSENPVFVKIGGRKLVDEDFDISRGSLKLPSGMVKAIAKHLKKKTMATVFLVGGFAANPWLTSEVKRRIGLMHYETEVRRAEIGTAKAAAHGAVSWYLDRLVTARVARHTFGTPYATGFDATNPKHRLKLDHAFIDDVTGHPFIGGLFKAILQKGQAIPEDATYRETFTVDSKTRALVKNVIPLIRYNGSKKGIGFFDDDPQPGSFKEVGSTVVEVPPGALVPCMGLRGLFWTASVEVVLTLGKTEMKWYMEWEEDGVKNK
ncbi:hypothetical protein FRB99_003525 [Tulasnella sp. 403]|nr:hypothetical protein FRB99_003525 [Tulasnella sp. 403]